MRRESGIVEQAGLVVVVEPGADGARDIGERVRAERQLRESEERFREVFEYAPYGICVSALDGRFLQVNAAFCRMVGYSERELLDSAWADLTHPDDLGPCLQIMDRLCEEPGGCLELEKRFVHRSGAVVWGRIKVSVVRDAGGNPTCHVVHVEDITERKRTEEALHESEGRFQIMADSCPAVMWVTDAEGGIQFINRAFRETCGVTLEQVAGGKALAHFFNRLTVVDDGKTLHVPEDASFGIHGHPLCFGHWRVSMVTKKVSGCGLRVKGKAITYKI